MVCILYVGDTYSSIDFSVMLSWPFFCIMYMCHSGDYELSYAFAAHIELTQTEHILGCLRWTCVQCCEFLCLFPVLYSLTMKAAFIRIRLESHTVAKINSYTVFLATINVNSLCGLEVL